ncbi:MAG: LysM peptidoglycan-binding domain-containing protein [Dehalococcoidia bacterium]
MQCFKCDQDAVQECPRCGALYCDDHGDALCDRCMDPVLAIPSYRVFRGSLVALLVGSIVAVWLLVLPPTAADRDQPPSSLGGVVPTAATPSPTAAASATGTPRPASPTPGASASPSASPTPTSTPTPPPTPVVTTYTVKPGDTLTAIADQFKSTPDAIQRANNISDPTAIQVGQVLTIPR